MGEGGEGVLEEVPRWDPGKVSFSSRLHALARLVRIEHTLFSLPFAYLGAVLAAGRVTLWEALWIGLAVLGLRTAAMAYNNIADLPIDALNPRSRMRPLVTGAVSVNSAWALVAAGSLVYYASAAALNKIALILSPILWIVAMTYPWAKRLHPCPHLHLGLTLGLVVFGGAIGAAGDEAPSLTAALRMVPWPLVAAVTLWVAGFDIVYSVMDYEFDKSMGLGSLPAALGVKAALAAAALCHAASSALLFYSAVEYETGALGLASALIAALLLAAQHALIHRRGLSAIPLAFNINLAVGLIVGVGMTLGALLEGGPVF